MPSERRLIVSVYADDRRLSLEGYGVFFNVDLGGGRDPNLASVTVHNLGAANRGIMSGNHQAIEILAGYDQPGKIFSGQTYSVSHLPPDSARPGWETVIEAGDGVKQFDEAWVSGTWPGGTPLVKVASDIGLEMQLPTDIRLTGSLRAPWAFNGMARDALSELSWDYACRWMIYQGILEVMPAGASVDKNQSLAVSVSRDTGMIGSPKITERKKKRRERVFGLSGKTKLIPDIRPGGLVSVSSSVTAGTARTKKGGVYQTPGANGTFVVHRVSHYGSLHAKDFCTEFETESFNAG